MTTAIVKLNDPDNNQLLSTVLLLISLMPDILTDHKKTQIIRSRRVKKLDPLKTLISQPLRNANFPGP